MRTVLLAHILDEEELLPHWLRHHVELFDHGILVDYHSTDRTHDIVREIAPHWELRPSAQTLFNAETCDHEIMAIERSLGDCWKMVLNVPEFVFLPSLKERLDYLHSEFPGQKTFAFKVVVMTDGPGDRGKSVTDAPLVLQRHYGYLPKHVRNWRCIHCCDDGRYAIGRHASVEYNWLIDSTYLLWFSWVPYSIASRRRLQIQLRVPVEDLCHGRGLQHILTTDEYEHYYQQQCQLGSDLLADDAYRAAFTAIQSRRS